MFRFPKIPKNSADLHTFPIFNVVMLTFQCLIGCLLILIVIDFGVNLIVPKWNFYGGRLGSFMFVNRGILLFYIHCDFIDVDVSSPIFD